jgi:hypothetical protein
MYNTKYECRYYKDDIILPDETVTNEEEDYIRNILYQEDFLNIFSINGENIEDDEIKLLSKVICKLYEIIKDSDVLKLFMLKASSKYISEDLQLGLYILYSYDYMYVTHKCVSEYLDTGFISLYNIDNMHKILE